MQLFQLGYTVPSERRQQGVGSGEKGEFDPPQQVFPRQGAVQVGAKGHTAIQGQERVRDTTEHGYNQHSLRVRTNPRLVVFCKRLVERLVRQFNAPMTANEQEPVLGVEPREGKLEMK